jgi:hypothetical protein
MCSTIGEKYGVLPSVVSEQATVFDLMCYDVHSTWLQWQQSDERGRAGILNTMDQEQLKKFARKPRDGVKQSKTN